MMLLTACSWFSIFIIFIHTHMGTVHGNADCTERTLTLLVYSLPVYMSAQSPMHSLNIGAL